MPVLTPDIADRSRPGCHGLQLHIRGEVTSAHHRLILGAPRCERSRWLKGRMEDLLDSGSDDFCLWADHHVPPC